MGNELTKEINIHKHAKEFDLSKHELTEIPKEIKNCKGLMKLDLSQNKIGDIPPQLRKGNCLIQHDSIVKLTQLQQIDLSNNVFNHLPPDLCKMKSITHLLISHNRLFYSPMTPMVSKAAFDRLIKDCSA